MPCRAAVIRLTLALLGPSPRAWSLPVPDIAMAKAALHVLAGDYRLGAEKVPLHGPEMEVALGMSMAAGANGSWPRKGLRHSGCHACALHG